MKLKNKLTLGITFLFVLIVSFGLLSIVYINRLSDDAGKILKDNQETLLYSNNMLKALETAGPQSAWVHNFDSNLVKQEHNITEPGEETATQTVRMHFDVLKANSRDSTQYPQIRQAIYTIIDLNQKAIIRKNIVAQKTADNATIWLTIIFTIIAIVSFTFVLNFPSVIANPIRTLSQGIGDIANKNYKSRIHINQRDEFGDLANAFNKMAAKLEEYDSSNLARILFEKKRIEAIINNMHDPVIGLDDQKKVLFVNSEALKISGLAEKDMIGRPVQDIAVTNDLIRSLIRELIQSTPPVGATPKSPLKIYADGKESFFEKDILTILSEQADDSERFVVGYVIILKNITPFKELDFAKTNFLSLIHI